jgi:hypothetical protein
MARQNPKHVANEAPAVAVTEKPVDKMSTAEKWEKVSSHFISGALHDALASVGWDFTMKPTPKAAPSKTWKEQLAVRQQAVKDRIAAGERPFADGSKSNILFDMLKAGTTKADILAAFPDWKEASIGPHVTEVASLVGYDVATTKFKSGKIAYVFDIAE